MHPKALRVRASLAVVLAAAVALTGAMTGATAAAASGPTTALNANDLAAGSVTADQTVGDFTIRATAEKGVTVDATDRISDSGDVYTQRIKLNGSGTAESRSIHFTAAEPTELIVQARSASGTADRALSLYNAGTAVATIPALADDETAPIVTETITVPAAGDYYLASPSSGVNVFSVQLGASDPVARLPWTDVAAPVIDTVTPDPASPRALLVTYTGVLGVDGGDVAHATLTNAEGAVVDKAIAATDGPLSLTPPASGDYTVTVQLTRAGETEAKVSAPVELPGFELPLAAAEITSALTTAVDGDTATVALEWTAVPEAETYDVEVATGGTFEAAATGVTGTETSLTLTPGATYQARVIAHRGADATTGPATEVTVAIEVERWQTADIGSNAGSGGSITDNGDGTITFDAKDSATKIATSEDGFQYYYTRVDPASENFTLNATFRVDDASTKDNQSGFGIIAVDDLVPGSSADRYFNSAGAMITRYSTSVGTQDGTPGARFVRGYTGATNDNTAGARDNSHIWAFDETYRADVSGPKFTTGDVYQLTLRKSNTGFHAIWHRDGQPIEIIEYDPDMLLQQNPDEFYVGMAVARKIVVTVTDWDFTTVRREDDEPAQEPPIRYIPTNLRVDVTATTPERQIDIPLVADFHGTGQVLDAAGNVLVDGLTLEPGKQALASVTLRPGENRFTARATPGPDQPQLEEREELASTDPVDKDVTITVKSYGLPGQSIWAAPNGSADATGAQDDPLDIYTATAFAQPGQQVVLKDGTYALTRKLQIDRGRNGTEDAPITLMSEPGTRAKLDLQNSPDGGLVLRSDWWHVYNLEITGSRAAAKPLLIQGNHNVIERIESHHNADTGVSVSGSSAEPPSMWPSNNLVISTESHHNADPGGNDADGFGVKLTVGEGNVLRYNIAHHNIDDGWDLFAKSITGPIGTVVVEDSVAYANGFLSENPALTGEGNGFKLGGESMPGDHLLRNSISFGNLGTGITSNSGPDVRLQNNTSVANERGIRLETNAKTTAYEASGTISWNNPEADVLSLKQADTSLLASPTNYFDGATADAADGRPAQVSADWFVSTDTSLVPRIADDGSIDMGGLFELTGIAPADTGARLTANPNPTAIALLPSVPAEPGPDAWYPTAVYVKGDRVQHGGVVYEAKWWTRNEEPGVGGRSPWVSVGVADNNPAIEPCATAWDAGVVYRTGEYASYDGLNYVAQWWTRGAQPGDSVRGSWMAVGECAG